MLTTAEYGTYDLFNTTIGVLLPVLTLNIQEAILRFSLDKIANKDAIVSIDFRYLAIRNIIVAIGLTVNQVIGGSNVVRNNGK